MNLAARDKLIIALDVDEDERAFELVELLCDVTGMFKVGSQLFTAAGPEVVRKIVGSGHKVFLDLKFHDIPNTVAAAAVEAARLGVSIFNVHAAGGREMMQRTADGVSEVSLREGLARPSVIAVTVLTSADTPALREVGIGTNTEEQVRRLAALAAASRMDGVVCSPGEIGLVRNSVDRHGFLIVTPGVRPEGSERDDQRRVLTPKEAIQAGADYIVVGRPVINAKDPFSAAGQVVAEIESALE